MTRDLLTLSLALAGAAFGAVAALDWLGYLFHTVTWVAP